MGDMPHMDDDEVAQLRAEIERLTAERDEAVAHGERLQEALAQFAENYEEASGSHEQVRYPPMRRIKGWALPVAIWGWAREHPVVASAGAGLVAFGITAGLFVPPLLPPETPGIPPGKGQPSIAAPSTPQPDETRKPHETMTQPGDQREARVIPSPKPEPGSAPPALAAPSRNSDKDDDGDKKAPRNPKSRPSPAPPGDGQGDNRDGCATRLKPLGDLPVCLPNPDRLADRLEPPALPGRQDLDADETP